MSSTSDNQNSPKNAITRFVQKITSLSTQMPARKNLYESASKLSNWFSRHPLYGTTAIIVFSNYIMSNTTAQQRANILEERNFSLLAGQQKLKDDFEEKLAKQETSASAIISDLKVKLETERERSVIPNDKKYYATNPSVDTKVQEQCSLWAAICSNFNDKNSSEPFSKDPNPPSHRK